MSLNQLFEQALSLTASDVHLATGEVPRARVSGELKRMDCPPLDHSAFESILDSSLSMDGRAKLEVGLPVEQTVEQDGRLFVGTYFRFGTGGMAATFRILAKEIPPLDVIGAGALPLFERVAALPRGLVIVSGATGSGKWTTVCSLVDAVNKSKAARIFVVESHPNFRFESREGLVTQLHVGQDLDSYSRALEVALHADLDLVAVDDIPTPELLREMLILAESGHLVIANMHADSAVEAVQKLLESGGEAAVALRRSLAKNLVAVTGQKLYQRKSGEGRVPAYEWIWSTPSVKEALVAGDVNRIASEQGTDPECRSRRAAVETLIASGEIEEGAG